MPTLSRSTGTGARYFLKGKKKYKVVSLTESLPVHPLSWPPQKAWWTQNWFHGLQVGGSGLSFSVHWVTSSPMEAVSWRLRGDLRRLNPQLDALSCDTEAKLKNYCDLLQWRISSGKPMSNQMAKWSMMSSSRRSPFLCGTTEWEGKRASPGPEHSDWWIFEKKSVPFTCRGWQTQQDDRPNHSKRTTRKQNDSSYGISMSLIKFFTVLTTTISLALYSLWFRDGPGV